MRLIHSLQNFDNLGKNSYIFFGKKIKNVLIGKDVRRNVNNIFKELFGYWLIKSLGKFLSFSIFIFIPSQS